MKEDQLFFICKHCGNIIGMIRNSGVPIVCCGEDMTLLVPNTRDGALEKHVPIVNIDSNIVNVNVGEVDHPMTSEHQISWIYIKTTTGGRRINLNSSDNPSAEFILSEGEYLVSVYAYCNLHGLWNTEV